MSGRNDRASPARQDVTRQDVTRPSVTRQTLTGAAWLVSWRMLTRSVGFLSTLVLARLLVTADFGLIAMATAFSGSIEALSQLGLQDALVRRRSDGMELHDAAFTLQLGRAAVTAVLVAAAAPAAAWWFDEPRLVPVLLVLAGVTLLGGFENVGIAEYRRAMRFDVQFRLQLARRLVGFAFTLGFALAFRSYVALLAGTAAGTLAGVAMSYAVHPFRPRLRLAGWRELAHFSLWTWAATVASLVWDRCDPFVLGPAFGPARLGLYLLALEVAILPVTELIAPAADALFSGFARSQREGTSSLSLAFDVAGLVLLLVIPVVLAISAAAGPVVAVLLGAKWAAAGPVVAVLTWICLFSPFSFVASSAMVANGYVRQNFWANVLVSVLKLAALVAAVSLTADLRTIAAVAVAVVAAEGVVYVAFLATAARLPVRPLLAALARAALALATAAAAVAGSGLGWTGGTGAVWSDLLRGVELGALSTLTFFAALLILWIALGRPEGPESRAARLLPLGSPRPLRRLLQGG